MLQRISQPVQIKPWRKALSEAIRDPLALCKALDLPPEHLPLPAQTAGQFPLRVPQGFVHRMRRGDPDDPLLRQVLPVAQESVITPGFQTDPVGDHDAAVASGILKKYRGRALLMTSPACAVHCRYCFRRHFPYAEHSGIQRDWPNALGPIAADPSINEVILSGGDPLSLPDDQLNPLIDALEAIPHVQRLRIHSRYPIVIPERVDDELCTWLERTRLTVVMVIHGNHPNEIDRHVGTGLARLRRIKITLLNQAVLLKGVNDDADTLVRLSETLMENGVLPYYLHMLDRVQGAAHFEVDDARALALMEALRHRLPGYLVPRLVRETAGQPYKTPLA